MPKIKFGKNHDNHERYGHAGAKDHYLHAFHFQHAAAHSAAYLFQSRVVQPPIAIAAAGSHPLAFVPAIVARDIQSRPASFAFILAPGI